MDDPVLLDEKYLDVKVRVQEDAILKERLGQWFGERTNEEITTLFMEHAIPGGPVSTLTDVVNDLQLRYRNDIMDIPLKNGGTAPFVKFPAKFSNHEEQQNFGAPALGEDNLSVLTEILGMSDEEAKKKKFAGNVTLYYFKEMGKKTAADYLLESSKPALIMQGGRDFQVLADDDFKAFRELLAGRDNTTYKLYPDLDHCFVNAIYDDILKASREYSVERHIGEDVIADIAGFIRSV